jgi:two-component system response regulator RegA
MPEGASLLIVEDDDVLRQQLMRTFLQRGFEVQSAGTAEEAARLAREDPPELALIDLRIGTDNGLDLIPMLRELDPGTRIVVLTGYGSIATAVEAVRRGAVHYLTKPADADQILAAFQRDAGQPGDEARPLQPMSLDRVEWEHINRVLVDCGGNVSEAARRLQVHRRTLQRKLSKYPAKS